MRKIIFFNDKEWHDAIIHSIQIDRSQPGYKDEIEFKVEWPNNTITSILFEECYGFISEMNFGVVASENILDAYCIPSSESKEIASLINKWEKIGVDLTMLNEFKIETNSTASTFRIFAMRVVEIIPN